MRSRYLSLVSALLLFNISACDQDKSAEKKAAPPGRFVAVEAAPEGDPLAWCDQSFTGPAAPKFAFPEVEADQASAPSPLKAGHWTWVNLWATWCKPCREEMPMLTQWEKKLDGTGKAVDLHFLSVDEDAEALATFWQEHAALAKGHGTSRLKSLQTMPDWFATYKLGANTPIPVQFLVAPDQKVRCIRMGSVTEDDYKKVERIIAQ